MWILDGVGRGTGLLNADETMWHFFERYALGKCRHHT